MLVYYGNNNKYLDITNIVISKCIHNDSIVMPASDVDRFNIIGIDPVPGVEKHIVIKFPDFNQLKFNAGVIINQKVPFLNERLKLMRIHQEYQLRYGTKNEEFLEQIMAVMFISPSDQVLEIGSNIGRNTLAISTILDDDSNFVTMECDPNSVRKLEENKSLNNRNFKIESSALSAQRLIQKGWQTIPYEGKIPKDFFEINIITYNDLMLKYNINFNVLVLDCEGAFFYILRDMPEILTGIEKIIIENDFTDINHKQYMDNVLTTNGFRIAFTQSGGWGPCFNCFYQVWTK